MSPTRRLLMSAAVLLLAAGAVRLGVWQLDRLHARRAANATFLAGREQPPLDLAAGLREGTPLVGRLATARGRFEPAGELLLRGRVNDKAPGLEVVTPFLLDSSAGQLWVLRGFIASPDAATPPEQLPPPTAGSVVIHGVLLEIPTTTDGGQPLDRLGRTTYRRLDRALAARLLPGAPPAYLLLEGGPAGPGGLPGVVAPALDDGPHLSYAIQWFGIALAIIAFGVIVLRRGDPARVPPPAAP